MDYIYHYNSPLGAITIASGGSALSGLWFDGQRYFANTISEETKQEKLPIFDHTVRWLDIYFSGRKPDFTPALDMRAGTFHTRVWEILLTIPYGKTMTYGEIADIIARENGKRKISARAVGSAVGHNGISLIIPCHRVIGADGSLTGYAGGIERKKKLLEMEQGTAV